MASSLDYATLRLHTPKELARHFQTFTSRTSNDTAVADQLPQAVHDEIIPPRVMTMYISVSRNTDIIARSLQSSSHAVRRAAIRLLSSKLRSEEWESAWEAVGGVPGLLRHFARSSVAEVKLLCELLGRSRVNHTSEIKKIAMTELFEALLRRDNGDHRPLVRYYAALLPACTTKAVGSVLQDDSHGVLEHVKIPQIERRHPELFRQHLQQQVQKNTLRADSRKWLQPLLQCIPSAPGTYSQFSATMDYSFDILGSCQYSDLKGNLDFYTDLAEPMLRRAVKRKVSRGRKLEILDRIVKYLQNNPKGGTSWRSSPWGSTSDQEGTLIRRVLRLWSRAPEVYMPVLCAVIALTPESMLTTKSGNVAQHTSSHIRFINGLLNLVSPYGKRRYDLLCLLLAKGDLTVAKSIKVEDYLPATFPPELLFTLPREDARDLLQHLIASRPDKHFLERSSARRSPPNSDTHGLVLGYSNVDFMEIFLDRGEEGALGRATVCVEARKTKAEKSRDQADRFFYAKLALSLAAASGSQQLYADTLIWTRRYLRDSKTMSQLYEDDVLLYPFALDLISGVPDNISRHDKLEPKEISERIAASNALLLDIIETACIGLREPSFNSSDWRTVRKLFRIVTQRRAQVSTQIQRFLRLSVSDEVLYDIMWKPTVEMLIAVETISMKDENEDLLFRDLLGPLKDFDSHDYEVASGAILTRFFQDLAIQRDGLWQHWRMSTLPAVLDLPEPWPQGLPIQCLTGSKDYTPPVVLERAERIVFLEAEVAMEPIPEIEDELDTSAQALYENISTFVDSYNYALSVYVKDGGSVAEEKVRTEAAWDHALHQLAGTRMTRRESILFWRKIFLQAGVEPPEDVKQWQPGPPPSDDPSDPVEWNPAHGRPPIIKSRPLHMTVLDYMLNADTRRTTNGPSQLRAFSTVGEDVSAFWSVESIGRGTSPGALEGYIISALLFLDGLKAGGERLLSEAHPHVDDPRYPSLYLDDEFLSLVNKEEDQSLEMLEQLLNEVPPTLLATATRYALDALVKSAPPPKLERICMNLLRLLAKSDRPELATEMILQVVVGRPDASSWHRLLLPRKFFNRLSPSQVQGFLSSFCDLIESRMQPSIEATEANAEKRPAPVKISTVKAFAQLLHEAEYVSPALSLQMLRRLFQKVPHIDVRTAIFDDFLIMLVVDENEEMREDVLAAIEDAIPIAGGINERHKVMSAQDWENIGKDDPLPEVSPTVDDSNAPLLQRLLTALSFAESPQKQELMDRIIVPIFRISMSAQRRWIAAFLQQNQDITLQDVAVSHFPGLPVQPELLCSLVHEHLNILPAEIDGVSMLDAYFNLVLTNMNPSTHIKAVNKYILASPSLRNTNGGQYMLNAYSRGLRAFNYNGSFHVVNLLKNPVEHDPVNGYPIERIKGFVFEVAKVLLEQCDDTFDYWSHFINAFEPKLRLMVMDQETELWIDGTTTIKDIEVEPSSDTESNIRVQRAWMQNCRPVLERIVEHIDLLRTPGWQRNPQRQPAVLPPTFEMRLWLMLKPRKDHLTLAAKDIWQMLSVIVERELYDEEFALLKALMRKVIPGKKTLLGYQLASLVDGLQDELGNYDQVDLLAIELVDALFRDAAKPMSLEQASEVRFVLDRWMRSVDEGVRMKGMRLVRFMETNHAQSFRMV